MTNQILFLGRYDEDLRILEQKVVNLLNSNQENLQIGDFPDVVNTKINKYNYSVWVILGDVKPTLLLKNLISEASIIILCFNNSDPVSLDFLNEGWGPIYTKALMNNQKNNFIDQKKILIETSETISLNIENVNDKIQKAIEIFSCDYFQQEQLFSILQDQMAKDEAINYNNNQKDSEEDELEDIIIVDLGNDVSDNPEEESQEKASKENKDIFDAINNDDNNDNNEENVNSDEYNDSNSNEDEISDDTENKEHANIQNIKAKIKKIMEGAHTQLKDKSSIFYNLYENCQKAIIVSSPESDNCQKASDDVFIPTMVNFNEKDFDIIYINDKAFSNTSIKSLSFASNSNIISIGDSAFDSSTITELYIPKNLQKLSRLWCKGADNLNKIIVDTKNPFFVNSNDFLYYNDGDKHEILFSPRNIEGEFLVPEEITRIANYSFSKRQGISSVKSLSPALKKIDSYAFSQCVNLKKIYLNNDSELDICGYCFSQSKNLSLVSFNCKQLVIRENCFKNCSSLSTIEFVVSDKIQLCRNAFTKCTSLNEISFSMSSEVLIGGKCFSGSTLNTVRFTDVKKIKFFNESFNECSKLENVSINKAVNLEIEGKCFQNLRNLKSIGFITDSIILKDNFANECSSLTFITIKSNKGSIIIYSNSFKNSCLKNVSIHAPKLKLCSQCFEEMKTLDSIKINSDDLVICSDCFKNCSLSSFQLQCKNISSLKSDVLSGCKIKNFTYIVVGDLTINNDCLNFGANIFCMGLKANSVNIEKQFLYFPFNSIIINAVAKIKLCERCFLDSTNLNSIEINGTEIIIDNCCFMNCISLESFIIGNKAEVLSLGTEVFNKCAKLKKFDIEAKKKLIFGDKCFIQSGIETVRLNSENITIKQQGFQNCLVKSVEITSTDESNIENSVFEGCKLLEKFIANAKKKLKLGSQCFASCTKLNSIGIQSNSIVIEKHCFINCSAMKFLSIAKSNNIDIKENVFEGCKKLETFAVTNATSFQAGVSCFANAINLKNLQIQSGKVIISSYCFSGCSLNSLFQISANDEVLLGDHAFLKCKVTNLNISSDTKIKTASFCFCDCKNLTSVNFICKTVFIGGCCFESCSKLTDINFTEGAKVTYYQSSFSKSLCDTLRKSKKIKLIFVKNSQDSEEEKQCMIF